MYTCRWRRPLLGRGLSLGRVKTAIAGVELVAGAGGRSGRLLGAAASVDVAAAGADASAASAASAACAD